MKKIISLVLVLALLFTVGGCALSVEQTISGDVETYLDHQHLLFNDEPFQEWFYGEVEGVEDGELMTHNYIDDSIKYEDKDGNEIKISEIEDGENFVVTYIYYYEVGGVKIREYNGGINSDDLKLYLEEHELNK